MNTLNHQKRANGEGSLYYEKSRDYWRATITLPNGKRKDFCSKSRNIAIQKRNQYISNNYKELQYSEKTIVECCEKYLDIRFKQNQFSENTYRTHLETLNRIKKSNLANMAIGSISTADINKFMIQELDNGKSKSILRKDKSMLKWGYKYALEMKLTENNPMESIFLTSNLAETKSEKVKALTTEEQIQFLKVLKENKQSEEPYSNIWLLAIFTGLRVGEICALKLEDIDLKNKKIYVNRTITRDILGQPIVGNAPKTSNGKRIVNFSETVTALLEEIIKNKKIYSEFLFSDDYGKFIKPTIVTQKLRKFNIKYNITKRLTTHMLRHTFATRMIEQNIPAFAIQHILGHSSIDITLDTYTDFFEEQKQKYTKEIDSYWSNIFAEEKCIEG